MLPSAFLRFTVDEGRVVAITVGVLPAITYPPPVHTRETRACLTFVCDGEREGGVNYSRQSPRNHAHPLRYTRVKHGRALHMFVKGDPLLVSSDRYRQLHNDRQNIKQRKNRKEKNHQATKYKQRQQQQKRSDKERPLQNTTTTTTHKKRNKY